jgi:copper chaperone CopZ
MKSFISKTAVLVYLIFSINSINIYSQTSNPSGEVNDPETVTSLIKVKGLTCAMDAQRISENVAHLEGVKECKVDKFGTTTRFEVTYLPEVVNEQKIYEAIEGTNGCENPDDKPYKVKPEHNH